MVSAVGGRSVTKVSVVGFGGVVLSPHDEVTTRTRKSAPVETRVLPRADMAYLLWLETWQTDKHRRDWYAKKERWRGPHSLVD